MRIPEDAIIADDKLLRYLLVPRPWDDKSGYLKQAGFTLENWVLLRDAIRRLSDSVEAIEDSRNEYGIFYRVDGVLIGPAISLDVRLIWIEQASDKRFRFVTLKPRKEAKS